MRRNPSLAALAAIAVATVCAASLNPDDASPELRITVLGEGPGAAGREYEALPGRTLLVFSYDLADPASRVMLADPWSVQSFLRLAPFGTHFMFAATSPNATEAQTCAEQLRASLTRAMLAAGLPEEVQRARRQQLFFATQPLAASAPWAHGLLAAWSREGRGLQLVVPCPDAALGCAPNTSWTFHAPRLDAWYDWLPMPASSAQPLPLTYLANPCCPARDSALEGRWVLAPHTARQCPVEVMVRMVQRAGGLGLILHAARSQDVQLLRPADTDLDLGPAPWEQQQGGHQQQGGQDRGQQQGGHQQQQRQGGQQRGQQEQQQQQGGAGAETNRGVAPHYDYDDYDDYNPPGKARQAAAPPRPAIKAHSTGQAGGGGAADWHQRSRQRSLSSLQPGSGHIGGEALRQHLGRQQQGGAAEEGGRGSSRGEGQPQQGGGEVAGGGDEEEEEEEELHIPLTMVSYEDGVTLRALLASTPQQQGALSLTSPQVPGNFFGIDAAGKLIELGWVKLPTLMHMAWQAQYQEYLAELEQRKAAEPPALELQAFDQAVLGGERGTSVALQLPEGGRLRRFTRMELDMRLSCQGSRDSDCPAWDHVIQLFACCGDGCHDCPITPYQLLPLHPHRAVRGQRSDSLPQVPGSSPAAPPQCGFELGRWITPFRRRTGSWLTDVTPLLPLLQPGRCQLVLQAPPWAVGWVASLSLRLSYWPPLLPPPPAAADMSEMHGVGERGKGVWQGQRAGARSPDLAQQHPQQGQQGQGPLPEHAVHGQQQGEGGRQAGRLEQPWQLAPAAAGGLSWLRRRMVQQPAGRVQQGIAGAQGLVPLATVPLFEGGSFDATYNNRSAMAVTVPSGAVKAIIMAVISGHGSDDNNCAEFCPTSHHFTVNGVEEHVASFDTAGSAWGCSQEVRRGALPNEHGTWFYGRNGWCDGQQVRPWLADVSAQLPASPSAWMASNSPDPLPRQQGGRAGQAGQVDEAGQAGEVGQQGQQGRQAGQGGQGGHDLLGSPGQLVISYRGLFKGKAPAPLPGSDPHIMMSSSITFWGSPGPLPS